MKDIQEVDQLVEIYKHQSTGIKHTLHKEQDYITHPKDTGYRGVHLVYKYGSDKSADYRDMRIEIQIRTMLQHAWATAVETVGTFINMPLKSSLGDEGWLNFWQSHKIRLPFISQNLFRVSINLAELGTALCPSLHFLLNYIHFKIIKDAILNL